MSKTEMKRIATLAPELVAEIRNAALEEAAILVQGSRLPDAYSEPCLEVVADEIRALGGPKDQTKEEVNDDA